MTSMKVLGIETSCDETAVAIVDDQRNILSHLVRTQLKEHEIFGGVVPEIAARAHLDYLPTMVAEALKQANCSLDDVDGIAATAGPGLIGGVIVGLMFGKAMASAQRKPLLGINHLVAHALTPRLSHDVPFPYLVLLVSGGHCQILVAKAIDDFQLLGQTIDDAVGEAFDKTAKLLGLDYPGGPEVEKRANLGDPKRFPLPRPLLTAPKKNGLNFSFSGLKTAVRQAAEKEAPLSTQDVNDLCASFQAAVKDVLAKRAQQAIQLCQEQHIPVKHLVVAGGVGANQAIRGALDTVCTENNIKFVAPPMNLCTDNAAMIAWAGIEKLRLNMVDSLSIAPRPRWPLPSKGT